MVSEKLKTTLKTLRFWILGALILLIGTIIFAINGGEFDKAIMASVYDASAPIGQRFPLQEAPIWAFFNDYNRYFTILLGGILLIMLFLSWVKKAKFGFIGKYAWYGIFSLAIGVGLVVNVIFKDMWGRPRPRMTTLWPDVTDPIGRFYSIWEPAFLDNPALIGEGVSFPSGHVSAIAAFIIIFYIFMNTKLWTEKLAKGDTKKEWIFVCIKWGSLVFTIVAGILTGIGRIVAGAHHPSDVLWAFGMVFIVNAILYYFIFQLPKYEAKLSTK